MAVKVCPATVKVPVRATPAVAAAVTLTVPLPLPLLPELIVNQAALLLAVHAQPAPAVTFTLPLPPATTKFWLVGSKA